MVTNRAVPHAWNHRGPMFQQQALLKKSCYHEIPQLGWRTDHPRLDSFVHDVQNSQGNVLNEPTCPQVVSPCLPWKSKRTDLAELVCSGAHVYRQTFTDFFKLVPKNGWVSFLFNVIRFVTVEREHAELLRSNSHHVNFTGNAKFQWRPWGP